MGSPNLNDGTPWADDEIRDLKWGLKHGRSIESIADFLCRNEDHVRDKAIELGLIRRPIFDAIQAIDGFERRKRRH